MAEINIICPNCKQSMQGEEGYCGMQINCPTCKELFLVTENENQQAAESPAADMQNAKPENLSTSKAITSDTASKSKKRLTKSKPRRSETHREIIARITEENRAHFAKLDRAKTRSKPPAKKSTVKADKIDFSKILSGNCPICHIGNLVPMDAGDRGTLFGQGNFLGAFIKSHRCSYCGYSI